MVKFNGRDTVILTMSMWVRLLLFLLTVVESRVDLYNTEDGESVEMFDCVYHANQFYCRRPTEPQALRRDQMTRQCFHHGQSHRFIDLRIANIRIPTLLDEWKSSIERVDEYSSYLEQEWRIYR